jgi:hypothetical protein
MAGLDPAIHVFLRRAKNVDARHKARHDEFVGPAGLANRVAAAATPQNFSFLNTASGSALMISITRRHLPLT